MRCLLCGKRLALLRKLTDGEFCSSAHRKRYVEEEQKLALARLVDEGNRSERARSPRRPDLAPAGNQRTEETAGFRPVGFAVAPGTFSQTVRPQPLERPPQTCLIERPGRGTAAARSLHALESALVEYQPHISAAAPEPGVAGSPGEPFLPTLQPRPIVRPASPQAARPRSAGLAEPAPRDPKDSARVSVRRPKASIFLKLNPPTTPSPGDLGQAQPRPASLLFRDRWDTVEAIHCTIALAEPAAFPPAAARIGREAPELRVTGITAEPTLATDFVAASGKLAPAVSWRPLARAGAKSQARWQSLPNEWLAACLCYPVGRPARHESAPAAASSARIEVTLAGLARDRVAGAGLVAESLCVRTPVTPGRDVALRDPSPDGAGLAHPGQMASDRHEARQLTPRSECFVVSTAFPSSAALPAPALECEAEPGLVALSPAPLAAATRRIDSGAIPPVPATPGLSCRTSLNAAVVPCPALRAVDPPDPASGAWERPPAAAARPLPPPPPGLVWHLSSPVRVAAPAELAALVALNWSLTPRRLARSGGECSFAPQPPAKPLAPRLRLETILSTGSEGEAGEAAALYPLDGKMAPWMVVSRFWETAPADLKWLSVALPAVLLVALVSAVGWLPSKPAQAASGAQASRSNRVQDVVRRTSASVRRNIVSRAAVNLQDDFRSGLAEWEGRGNWGKGWQYDPAGFVLTGPLALFRPSLELSDYRFEFLGQIDRKSLNWVFRAADHNNYYAMKIVLLTSAPLSRAVIQRYAVIDGIPDRVVQTALPMTGRNDTFLRVRVDVRGQNFTTSVQDHVVDFWSDDRLGRGGVGFFSEKGERARLRWVEVSHQYDALGRLCALLAPHSIQSGNGSLDRP